VNHENELPDSTLNWKFDWVTIRILIRPVCPGVSFKNELGQWN
jgi:hypothetical protein